MENSETHTGIVKIFDSFKGYGFITRQKGRDIFFHYLDIITENSDAAVMEGDHVEFVIGTKDNKQRALRVKKLG